VIRRQAVVGVQKVPDEAVCAGLSQADVAFGVPGGGRFKRVKVFVYKAESHSREAARHSHKSLACAMLIHGNEYK
jgi:hypothetical protein